MNVTVKRSEAAKPHSLIRNAEKMVKLGGRLSHSKAAGVLTLTVKPKAVPRVTVI